MDRITWTTVLPAPGRPDGTKPHWVIANHITGESIVVPAAARVGHRIWMPSCKAGTIKASLLGNTPKIRSNSWVEVESPGNSIDPISPGLERGVQSLKAYAPSNSDVSAARSIHSKETVSP